MTDRGANSVIHLSGYMTAGFRTSLLLMTSYVLVRPTDMFRVRSTPTCRAKVLDGNFFAIHIGNMAGRAQRVITGTLPGGRLFVHEGKRGSSSFISGKGFEPSSVWMMRLQSTRTTL
jgi:hypothetical protein